MCHRGVVGDTTRVEQSRLKLYHRESCPTVILSCVPDTYERIRFSELKPGQCYKNRCIMGRICYLTEVKTKRRAGNFRKCLLSDAFPCEKCSNVQNLSVFLFDGFAAESTVAEVEGYIAICNFEVEPLTLGCSKVNDMTVLPVQVLVKDDTGCNGTGIWIAKKVLPELGRVRTEKQASKVQREPHQECDESPPSVTKKRRKNVIPTVHVSAERYVYVLLNEIVGSKEERQTFNVYGIVEDCHLRVRPGHRVQTLDLILCDPTKSEFQVLIFSVNETFPDVQCGDAVRIHRMTVEMSRSKLRGKCYSPKFILVFNHKEKEKNPVSVANHFTLTSDDRDKVSALFDWDEKRKWKVISDVKAGEFFNVVCQVVSVYNHYSSDSILITVWDGTKNDAIVCHYRKIPTALVDEDLLNVARDYLVHMWASGDYAISASELKPGQFIEVLDVVLTCPKGASSTGHSFSLCPPLKENRGISLIEGETGRLLQLKNRLEKIVGELSSDVTHSLEAANGTSFFLNCDVATFSPQNNRKDEKPSCNKATQINVQARAPSQSNEATQINVEARAPGQSPTTELSQFSQFPCSFLLGAQDDWWKSIPTVSASSSHSNIRPSTLQQVAVHSVPYKFRIFAVVLNYQPETQHIEDIVRLYCSNCHYLSQDSNPNVQSEYRSGVPVYCCPKCCTVEMKYIYMLSFSMHDGSQSGAIDVFLLQDNAVRFFRGISPEDALLDTSKADLVFKTIWEVCPNSHPNRRSNNNDVTKCGLYPTLDCCIMSYTAGGVTRYQMFDTYVLSLNN